MYCAKCGAKVALEGSYCHKCGSQLASPISASIPLPASDSIRKGTSQARFNEKYQGILATEIFLVSIAAGLLTKSWWCFGGCFLGLAVAIQIKPLAIVLALALSGAWEVVGFNIGMLFESNGASAVLGIMGFLVGLGANLAGIQWVQDTAITYSPSSSPRPPAEVSNKPTLGTASAPSLNQQIALPMPVRYVLGAIVVLGGCFFILMGGALLVEVQASSQHPVMQISS